MRLGEFPLDFTLDLDFAERLAFEVGSDQGMRNGARDLPAQQRTLTRTIQWSIEHKLRMTVAVPGGTQEVGVPRFLQDKACLGENQAQAIARMARQLEAEMGSPIDIECAIADGELYLLQCRPVTG